MSRKAHGERGAILVYVAISLLGLTAISAIVVDYGVFWVARRQAQNAADAGALAGALALAFDDFNNRGVGGPAKEAAMAVATGHEVWMEAPSVLPASDITFPAFPACPQIVNCGPICGAGQSLCIRVDVHRSQERGAALPTFFAQLVGVTEQSVRATATAQVVSANATDCLKPMAIGDRWFEITTPATPWHSGTGLARFNRYDGSGTPLPPAGQDIYLAPSSTNPGTGLRVDLLPTIGGVGYQLTLTEAPSPMGEIGPGQFIPIDLPRAVPAAGSAFQANIESCNGVASAIGENLTPLAGSTIAQATAAAATLRALDPNATWNPITRNIQNSCAQSNPPCAAISPRLIALPVFDVGLYEDTRWPDETLDLRIVNMIGFFIETVLADRVVGRITYHPGLLNGGASTVTLQSAFLRTALLVR
jgi:hypothetical protein